MTSQSVLDDTIGRCRQGIVAAAIFSLFLNALLLTAPLYMLQVFDRVLTSRSQETLLYLTLIALVAFCAYGALELVRGSIMDRVGNWFDSHLAEPVLRAGVIEGLGRASARSVQGLRDLAAIRGFLTGPSVFPILDMPWTPIFLLAVFTIHPMLGWLSTVGAFVLLALALLNEFSSKPHAAHVGRINIAALQQADAAVRNADAVQSMGMLPAMIGRWMLAVSEALRLQSGANRLSGFIRAVVKVLRMSMQVGILGAGAWLVLGSELTAGGMIAASILMARALAPIDQSIAGWRAAIQTREAFRRLKELLARTDTRTSLMPLPRPSGEVSVENVTYFAEGTEQPIVRKLSFEISAGTGLGIVGPTAAGKTTLVRLMVGTLRPRGGHVRLDGMNIFEWDADDRGRHVGYLPQDVELFDVSVRENIARMSDADPDDVIAAAKLANAHDMILRLPQGYDTRLGEGGALLSGGQRQRIGLARAVYGNPSLVVLDEPAASLDQEGETALVNTLMEIKARKVTVVVVAHRPNILRALDRILVMRDGEAKMFGPRDEVLARISQPQSVAAAGNMAG
jgi:ATP-binding cassette subfamily B protein/ATP-binding cassette subfamily C protein